MLKGKRVKTEYGFGVVVCIENISKHQRLGIELNNHINLPKPAYFFKDEVEVFKEDEDIKIGDLWVNKYSCGDVRDISETPDNEKVKYEIVFTTKNKVYYKGLGEGFKKDNLFCDDIIEFLTEYNPLKKDLTKTSIGYRRL